MNRRMESEGLKLFLVVDQLVCNKNHGYLNKFFFFSFFFFVYTSTHFQVSVLEIQLSFPNELVQIEYNFLNFIFPLPPLF